MRPSPTVPGGTIRWRSVRPQSFDGMDLELCVLHADMDVASAIELAISEYVAVGELGAHGLLQALRVVGDAVVREQPARTQDAPDGRQVGRQVGQAQMIEQRSPQDFL